MYLLPLSYVCIVFSLRITSSLLHGYRGPAAHFLDSGAIEFYRDGLLVVDSESGEFAGFGNFDQLSAKFSLTSIQTYSDSKLIVPGSGYSAVTPKFIGLNRDVRFVDCHSHAPQIDMIASYGDSLLEWLFEYTFPYEAKYQNQTFANASAKRFFNQLVRSGTTSALIYNAMFPEAVTAIFQESRKRNLRIISDINNESRLMCNSMRSDDLNGTLSAEVINRYARDLYKTFHGSGRSLYALMPRFLTTCTPASLEVWSALQKDLPGVWFHTHIAENLLESQSSVSRFKQQALEYYGQLSPKWIAIKACVTQLEIFAVYGLVGQRSSFAHGIHLTHADYDILRTSSASLCHCPTSNLFLDSGLFNLGEALANNVSVGVGTDIGAGTTFELLATMGETYKVAMASHDAFANSLNLTEPSFTGDMKLPKQYHIPLKSTYRLSPLQQLYMITLGTAKQLNIDKFVGNFDSGKEADFVVLDLIPSPLLRRRFDVIKSLTDADDLSVLSQSLFGIITVPNDRTIMETYVAGVLAYDRGLNYHDDLDSDYESSHIVITSSRTTIINGIEQPIVFK